LSTQVTTYLSEGWRWRWRYNCLQNIGFSFSAFI